MDFGELDVSDLDLGDLLAWVAAMATRVALIVVRTVMGMDLGDLPSWIEAIATVAALSAAVYAGLHAAKLLKIEINRDREREENERRQQASLVAAWRGVVPAHPDVQGNTDGTYGPVVRNASELPIYQVNVQILLIGGGEMTFMAEVLPPGQWFVHYQDRGFYTTQPVVLNPALRAVPDYQVAVAFRDAAGNMWRRDVNGNLRHTGVAVFPELAVARATVGAAHDHHARRAGPGQPLIQSLRRCRTSSADAHVCMT
jgi:hypothetical protein